MQKIYQYIEASKTKYVVFWVIIFIFSASGASALYASTGELVTVYGMRVSMQIVIAYVTIEYLIPHLLTKGKNVAFGIAMVTLLFLFYTICTMILMYYLEPTYPTTYINYLKRFDDLSLMGRLTHGSEVISKSLNLLYPTFLILVLKLYHDKQRLLKLTEQKKTAELTALKNQLNPHFLFNTLNNLYALALKKSDDTTIVIQKLSGILDYILYRCNADYVPLDKEIELIENYLSLEKVRYGDRVKIEFSKNVTGKEKIAPLLLLTFIENAFKHGVTEEIGRATIQINISKKNDQIIFNVENSKPVGIKENKGKESIGLGNIKKQLELLYPKAYDLIIENHPGRFSANLKLDLV